MRTFGEGGALDGPTRRHFSGAQSRGRTGLDTRGTVWNKQGEVRSTGHKIRREGQTVLKGVEAGVWT